MVNGENIYVKEVKNARTYKGRGIGTRSDYKDLSKTVDDNMNEILDDLTEIQTNVLAKGSLEDKLNFLISLEIDRLRTETVHGSYAQQTVMSQVQVYKSWAKQLCK